MYMFYSVSFCRICELIVHNGWKSRHGQYNPGMSFFFKYTQWRIQGGPPAAQNFLGFMQFWGNFDKIVCWRPPGSRRPLLQGILDPPLSITASQRGMICCVARNFISVGPFAIKSQIGIIIAPFKIRKNVTQAVNSCFWPFKL